MKNYEFTASLGSGMAKSTTLQVECEKDDTMELIIDTARACRDGWWRGTEFHTFIVDRTWYDHKTDQWVYDGTFSVQFSNPNICTECLVEELGVD